MVSPRRMRDPARIQLGREGPPRGRRARVAAGRDRRRGARARGAVADLAARRGHEGAGQADIDSSRSVDLERQQNLYGLGRRGFVGRGRDRSRARRALDARARTEAGRRLHVRAQTSDPQRVDLAAGVRRELPPRRKGLAFERAALRCAPGPFEGRPGRRVVAGDGPGLSCGLRHASAGPARRTRAERIPRAQVPRPPARGPAARGIVEGLPGARGAVLRGPDPSGH
mmetsp:Transcript_20453/g.61756  ORF Transcript_20453/g.61756 Transcript_20453/m.61756 type:complete len:227 (+) Transcript_20453:657-1337(+)